MAKVLQIAISKVFKGQMKKVEYVQAVADKGLIDDRHFKEDNGKRQQITLIEIENIDYYNKISGSNIQPINFRRNIITEGIRLNELLGSEFFVGEVKVKAHDFCRPCRYLQESLKQKNLVKELLHKAGLRCEILNNGKIFVGDEIKNYI